MQLDRYQIGSYTPGASLIKQILWYFIGDSLVRSRWLPFSGFKVAILRCFGAQIGQQVRIKPDVQIKFPWRLQVGDFVWLGERVWIDNLAPVTIESHVCISQEVYFCTGNHDWSDISFSLQTEEIYIERGSWIAARAAIAPGVKIGCGAVLSLGSIATHSLESMTIYTGNPAQPIKKRAIA